MSTVTRITSRDNALLVRVRRLVRAPAAYRREGVAWIEGEHLCSAWQARGARASQAVVSESAWLRAELRALAESAERTAVVPDALFASASDLPSPAGLGFLVPWSSPPRPDPRVASVVLDRLQDAGNVGSILRSAAALGYGQVIALEGTAALWSPKVLRAGMGAHFGLRLIESAAPDVLSELEVPLLATSSHAGPSLEDGALPYPCAWVFGHEGQGVAAEVLARCRQVLRIAQPGGEESLNVAAAAAICLYAGRREERRR
ncbi:MAG TPA: RNA methyltransferase [Burkholderiaceae bacterium]|nr:RNA methyltransferase [Burkholderiaceae bacterium]